jgi:hypothetical protein
MDTLRSSSSRGWKTLLNQMQLPGAMGMSLNGALRRTCRVSTAAMTMTLVALVSLLLQLESP